MSANKPPFAPSQLHLPFSDPTTGEGVEAAGTLQDFMLKSMQNQQAQQQATFIADTTKAIDDMKATEVTAEHAKLVVKEVNFFTVPDAHLTVCAITTVNGTVVTGHADHALIKDADAAKQVAHDAALGKLVTLEQYLLAEAIHSASRHLEQNRG